VGKGTKKGVAGGSLAAALSATLVGLAWAAEGARAGKTDATRPVEAAQSLEKLEMTSGQHVVAVPKELKDSSTIAPDYLLYLPDGYGATRRKWPLMLFLHGKGECGEDIALVRKNGPPMLVGRAKQQLPFIVVSPQCRKDKWWDPGDLMKLLERVQSKLAVDDRRIYVSGLSMGGFGTWAMITAYPKKFAAAVPICGGGNPALANKIKNLPVWVFHGDADETVPLERSQAMVDALEAARGKVQFTVYPGVGHDSWTRTYANPEVFDWLLKQKR